MIELFLYVYIYIYIYNIYILTYLPCKLSIYNTFSVIVDDR